MEPHSDREERKLPGGLSRDKKRLAIGLGFMALLLGGTLMAVFLLGRPAGGGGVALGVPVLLLVGWVVVIAATLTFYRVYRGE